MTAPKVYSKDVMVKILRNTNGWHEAQVRHARLDAADRIEELEQKMDALLNHCDKENGECSECSKIICPHACPLHFHHDGCPACATADERQPVRNAR